MPSPMGNILLLAAVIPLILGLLMAVYWHSRRVYRGFGYWVAADIGLGLSYILLGFRGQIPDFLSVISGNVLAVYCLILIYEGTEIFFGRQPFNTLNHLLLLLYMGLQLYLTYVRPNINARVLLASAVLMVLNLRVAYSLLSHPPERLRPISRIIAAIFVLSAFFSLARGVYAEMQSTPLNLQTDPTLFAAAFGSICSITIWSFTFLFINSARVELDLEDAGVQLARSVEGSRRELAQLALLEEAGQLISSSLDEGEILRSAVETVVSRFGYAEAAVSMLVNDFELELSAVAGTEDIGFRAGYRQKLGEGIIGHVGQTEQIYVTGEVEHDPYYYTIGHRTGSAAGIPLISERKLYGVLYIESVVRDAFTPTELQTLRTLVAHMVTAINKARLHASTQEHLVVMTTLHRISQIITSSLELERIFQTVLQLLKDTFGYTHISIYLLEDDTMKLGAQIGYPDEFALREIPVTDGIVGRTVQTKKLQLVRDVSQDPSFLRAGSDVNSEICVPLFRKGNILGVINVESAAPQPLTERDADVLTALAGPVAIAIDNAHLHAEAKSLAQIDGLTHLMNRRTFDETLQAEVARAARYHCPLTLLILDIDDFKSCNDQWGHLAGDALLRATARLIKSQTRSTDGGARYGGDEFAIILPNTALEAGMELAERLRGRAQALGRRSGESDIPPVDYTISVGVACFPAHGQTAEQLLVAADLAELTAKKLGKNRVCSAKREEA